MSVTLIMTFAAVIVAATFITASRVLGVRTILRHATVADVLFTILLAIVMGGTLTGMLIALSAGLVAAACLSVGRFIMNKIDALAAGSGVAADADLPSSGDWGVLQ